ncbi:hypothetical protein AB4341_05790 [Vibrio breoganii]
MIKKITLTIVFALLGTLTYLFWLPVKMVANSIVTTEFVTQSINSDIRAELIGQPSFIEKIENHKGPAKRYLHRTPLTAFTTIDTGMYDVYATYINDKGEWVVRMGVYPDKNAETFFPEQIGGFYGELIGFAIYSINSLIEWGVLKPMLYHVTNSTATSFASSSYEAIPGLI